MRRRVLLSALVLIIFCVGLYYIASAHGVTDGRHGINVIGANGGMADWEADSSADWLAGTGVQWAMLPVVWEWAEPDPYLPYDDGGRWQGPSGNWHRYNLNEYVRMYNRLRNVYGANVVVGLYRHPRWAGGNYQCTGNPFSDHVCGIVYNDYKPI